MSRDSAQLKGRQRAEASGAAVQSEWGGAWQEVSWRAGPGQAAPCKAVVEDFGPQVKWLWAAQLQEVPFTAHSVVEPWVMKHSHCTA